MQQQVIGVDLGNELPYCQLPIFSEFEGHFAAHFLRVLIDRADASPDAPDLTDAQLEDIVSIAREISVDGIIATNTTLSREGLRTGEHEIQEIGAGGLSGAPIKLRSRQVVSSLYRQLDGKIPIVGVGGIFSGEDAWQMILSGASLLQIYTGFVYGGPSVVRDINRYLLKQLQKRGLAHIKMAVGGQDEFG